MELAMIREKQFGEEEKMSRSREAQRECQKQLQSKDGGSALQLLCLSALSQDLFSRKGTLRELQAKTLKAQEELLEASRSRRIVEKLRDRDFERYRQRISQAEQKFLDDIAAGRFARMGSQSQ